MVKAVQSILNKIVWVLLLGGLALAGPLSAQTPARDADTQAALDAMPPWLNQLDSGDYAETWKEAGQTFQKTVTLEGWVQSVRAVHDSLGACLKRSFVSAFRQPSLPPAKGLGVPADPVVVAQFESSFENLKHAIETVSFEKQADGTWRAAGYYVKPG